MDLSIDYLTPEEIAALRENLLYHASDKENDPECKGYAVFCTADQLRRLLDEIEDRRREKPAIYEY